MLRGDPFDIIDDCVLLRDWFFGTPRLPVTGSSAIQPAASKRCWLQALSESKRLEI